MSKLCGRFSHSSLKSLSFVSGMLLSLSGCSTGSSQLTKPAGESGVFAGPAGLFTGTWAKKGVFTSTSSALGISAKSSVIRYVLLKGVEVDGKLQVSEQTCDIKTSSSGSTSVAFSQALIRSITDNQYTYQLPTDGSTTVSMTKATELLGIKLSSPESESLDPAQEKSYDQDGDGKPGVSADVSARVLFTSISGQVYVVQRTIWSETGTWDGAGKVSGLIDWSVEQKTLGSSNPLLSAVTPKITTLTNESPFYMVKIDEGSGCQDVLDQEGKGF